MFLLLLTVAWAFINNYLVRRVQSALGWQKPWHRWLRYAIVLFSFNYIYGRILERTFGVSDWVAVLFHIGAFWVGAATIAFCTFAMADLVRMGIGLSTWRRSKRRTTLRAFLTRPWTRLGMLGLLATSTMLSGLALYTALAPPVVERYTVTVDRLDRPVKVALLSDLHLGHLGTSDHLASALEVVRREQVDVVLIPGDLVDETSPDVARGVAMIAALEPPLGVYVTLGNHERYSGLDFFQRKCREHGIRILRQERVELVRGVALAGVDDLRVLREADLALEDAFGQALDGIPEDFYTILMFHRPVRVEEAFARRADLVLSGHTHGGQLPPFQILSPFANDFHLAGPYHHDGGLLYVTSGAGFWGPPMRLFAEREVVILDLVPDRDS